MHVVRHVVSDTVAIVENVLNFVHDGLEFCQPFSSLVNPVVGLSTDWLCFVLFFRFVCADVCYWHCSWFEEGSHRVKANTKEAPFTNERSNLSHHIIHHTETFHNRLHIPFQLSTISHSAWFGLFFLVCCFVSSFWCSVHSSPHFLRPPPLLLFIVIFVVDPIRSSSFLLSVLLSS